MSRLSGWKVVCLAVAGVALSLLAANVVRADSFSDKAAALDIVGVHLGMTPAEAKSALAQYRKGMQWIEDKGDLGISAGQFLVRAQAQWGTENVSVVFSPPPGEPKVVAVDRKVQFDRSQPPTVENLTNSLTRKFGQPSNEYQVGKSDHQMVWAWDKSGQQLSKPSPANIDIYYFDYIQMRSNWSLMIKILQRDNDVGGAIAVRAFISARGGIADRLQTTLVDPHDALPAAVAANNYAKQARQAKAEAALKQAGAN